MRPQTVEKTLLKKITGPAFSIDRNLLRRDKTANKTGLQKRWIHGKAKELETNLSNNSAVGSWERIFFGTGDGPTPLHRKEKVKTFKERPTCKSLTWKFRAFEGGGGSKFKIGLTFEKKILGRRFGGGAAS